MSKDLTILAVTSELPWPLDTGGHLRTFHLLKSLATEYRVRLVTGAPPNLPLNGLAEAGVSVVSVHNGLRRGWHEVTRMVGASLRMEPYVMYRRHHWGVLQRALQAEVDSQQPEVLYLDHLDSFLFAPAAKSAAIVGDFHNIYSLLATRASEEETNIFRRIYLANQARLLARMEHRAAKRADVVLTVSDREQRYFRDQGAREVRVVPNGIDCARYAHLPAGREGREPIILYVGAMSWQPNAAAARFLAFDVLPAVRQRIPTTRLRIVGRDPPPAVMSLTEQPGVEVTGRVDDVVPHLEEAHLLAVPLEAGGGTRLKILEAFAAGLPVVSTAVGCEGINVHPAEHLVVVPRESFAEAIISLLANPATGKQMAVSARRLVHATYDWTQIGKAASEAIRAVLERRR